MKKIDKKLYQVIYIFMEKQFYVVPMLDLYIIYKASRQLKYRYSC